MRYRRFGKTEIQMPVFSCGGMRYQHNWQDEKWDEIPESGQRNLEATIRRSLELGINHIETARGYGTSEYQLGKILPVLPRDEMVVQTKVSPFPTVEEFTETFETSMERLGLDYVDLFSLHGVNNDEVLEQAIRPGGCLEKALEWKKDGRVRHVGFSTHAPLDVILKALDTGAFEYFNVHWYFIFEFNWPAIERARELDMGVFIISPSDKGGKLYEPPQKLVELCSPLSPMAFNDLYCLMREQVHTLSVGASRPTDFDEHVAALEHLDAAAEIIPPIAARIRKEMGDVLGTDWLNNWWKGLPRFEDVPGHVNLFEILRLWSLAKSLDMIEFGKMRYNMLGNAGHYFPGQKADKADAREIRERLEGYGFADRVPEILAEAHRMFDGQEGKRLSSA